MYKLCPPNEKGIAEWVLRLPDNTLVRIADDNPHYQVYLKWLEAGNTPIPADEENK